MRLPLRRKGTRSRGQAVVEFAIMLPILALLMVMSLDFGRVFFGWVGLQNVVRIGANYAAVFPDAWDPNVPPSVITAKERAQYITQITQEAAALNCSPLPNPNASFAAFSPQPTFADTNGNTRYDLGEWVTLSMSCQFNLLTPLANGILGGGVTIGSTAIFPVRGGGIAGIPITPPSASASASASASSSASASASSSACPLPIAAFDANPTSGKKQQTFVFTNTSQTFGCSVQGYMWDFGDSSTSTLQNPTHQYSPSGGSYDVLYDVRLTVNSPGGTSSTLRAGYIHVCKNC